MCGINLPISTLNFLPPDYRGVSGTTLTLPNKWASSLSSGMASALLESAAHGKRSCAVPAVSDASTNRRSVAAIEADVVAYAQAQETSCRESAQWRIHENALAKWLDNLHER